MRIVFIEVENYRGIKELKWAPSSAVNCLIGPGDTTKTTILDAIELALNPRSYVFADDSDFYDLDFKKPISITVTIGDLPPDLKADNRYGLYLRGWDAQKEVLEDEPAEGLEEVLSTRVVIDESLEARWSIFNLRIAANDKDPPSFRLKDAKQLATTRLGPFAERHLGWGRQSVLTRIGDGADNINLQLAQASRAAREAFGQEGKSIFADTVKRAETLGELFSVPVRTKYAAELDVQGVSITTGGISLHDGKLPLRRLGTGSSRLIVSALQHEAGRRHIALIDEIEHGLEPHRIARLLKFLKSDGGDASAEAPQIFTTTHSPVVIRELAAADIFAVRSDAGTTSVRSVAKTAKDLDTAQRHLRGTPEAFLASKVIVGEGRTEQGLLRGLDAWWSNNKRDSFALSGAIAVDGGGVGSAPMIADHLLDLGYAVFLLLDTDVKADAALIATIKKKGGIVYEWPDDCSTEERVFLDVPWTTLIDLVKLAETFVGSQSILDRINAASKVLGSASIADLGLPKTLDSSAMRRAIGRAAKNEKEEKKDKNPWFKNIDRGEQVAPYVAGCLGSIPGTPLAKTIEALRQWIDA